MKSFFACVIFCAAIVSDICAMSRVAARSFGNTAHNNPNSLYMATVNVGTGECHVIRHGDDSIIIDGGIRRGPASVDQVIDFLEDLLGHNWRPDPLDSSRVIFDQSTVQAIFVTHPHDDHTNLIEDILNDINILKSNVIVAFLGGLDNEYEQSLVDTIIGLNQNALLGNGIHNISGLTISAFDVDSSFDSPSDPQDVNRFGAVVGLSFANRRVAFLGDIDNDGFKGIVRTAFGSHIGQPVTAPVHPMCNFLLQADIVTTPHHGLLNNQEGYIYKSLLRHCPNRVFLVSGSPNDLFHIFSDILIDLDQATRLAWQHDLSLYNLYIDHQAQKFTGNISTNLTNIPLFSTYDAPGGFIWTRIDVDGKVYINNGLNFRRVL